MTRKDNHINRYGEKHATPAFGRLPSHITYQDEYGMNREEEVEEVDWTHDPRSESAREKHFGKGPKGWEPDAGLKQKASIALYLNPFVDASEIEVSVENRCVFLTGTVHNRIQKKSAEYCIDDIPGVEDVINKLVIKS